MSREDLQTNLRLPSDLKAWLAKQAAEARRSVNAEVVLRLEQSRKQQEAKRATS